ncbi:MAG: hypothetical protein IJ802_04450 [Kiritimatiellae bacterium]|nr:hypothetical protein [Kiritimatiellia bacterium]
MKTPRFPTIDELLSIYPRIAALERMKSNTPCVSTVRNNITAMTRIVTCLEAILEIRIRNEPITCLTAHRLNLFLTHAAQFGLGGESAWSYVQHLRGLVARWTRGYFEEIGFKMQSFSLPSRPRRKARYSRPERSTLRSVRDWYESLAIRSDKREWLAATLMLEFAMRNSDVRRLKWSDFRERDGGMVLCYTPHKTALSSGRIVAWPVHPRIWSQMCRARELIGDRLGTHFHGYVIPAAAEVFIRLNRDIRDNHFFSNTNKALYELRKICIDHVYQSFGAEAASAISGDDIRTVTQYYADPSAVTVRDLRIVDLL